MSDDELAVRLLHPLREEPGGPSAVDVRRAMAEGRRRRRLRRWSGGVALAALTAVAAGGGTVAVTAMHRDPEPRPSPTATARITAKPTVAAPVPPSCTVSLLPTGGIAKALVTAGDPSGRWLAGRVYPTGSGVHTVLWKDGKLQKSTPAIPGEDADINDLTTAGVGVGSGFDSAGKIQAYILRDSTVRKLRGGEGEATAINGSGVIVGTLGQAFAARPAKWASADATPTKLPVPSGVTSGDTVDIAEDGTIVGNLAHGSKESSGYLWLPDGTGRAIAPPTVDGTKATYFWAESMSNGWVAGRAVFDTGDGSRGFTSMRYNIATGAYQELATTLGPPALAATNGWILGVSGDSPVIVAGSKMVRLPRYGKQKEYEITSFSSDGTVAAGYSSDGFTNGEVRNLPLVWRCH